MLINIHFSIGLHLLLRNPIFVHVTCRNGMTASLRVSLRCIVLYVHHENHTLEPKHEVDRMTNCRDMAVRNLPK